MITFPFRRPQARLELEKIGQMALALPEGAKGTGLGLAKKTDDKKDASKDKKKK